jgi:hypothetical protein
MNFKTLIEAGMKPGDVLKLRAKLFSKIETLSNEIGGLKKEGRCELGGGRHFMFISHEQVTEAIRPLLPKLKLSIVPEVLTDEERDYEKKSYYQNKEKISIVTRTKVNILIHVCDTETGFLESFKFGGAEQDHAGKSYQQAVSQSVKYAMFKLLKITEGEPDPDSRVVKIEKQPAQKTTASKTTAKKETTKAITNIKAIKAALTKIKTHEALNKLFKGVDEGLRIQDEYLNLFTDKRNELIKSIGPMPKS